MAMRPGVAGKPQKAVVLAVRVLRGFFEHINVILEIALVMLGVIPICNLFKSNILFKY
jgi:hypothetical protein